MTIQKSVILHWGGGQLFSYLLKGTIDEAPNGEFKEEDHPRGGKGSKEGGRFVKSEKTKKKEDEVDNINVENIADVTFEHTDIHSQPNEFFPPRVTLKGVCTDDPDVDLYRWLAEEVVTKWEKAGLLKTEEDYREAFGDAYVEVKSRYGNPQWKEQK